MSKLTSEVAEAVYSQSAKIGQTLITAKRCVGEKNLLRKIVLKLWIYGGWVTLELFSEVIITIFSRLFCFEQFRTFGWFSMK